MKKKIYACFASALAVDSLYAWYSKKGSLNRTVSILSMPTQYSMKPTAKAEAKELKLLF